MTNNTQKDNSPLTNIWPNRYCVGARVDRFCHEKYIYKDVFLEFFQVNLPEYEARCILTSLGYIHNMTDQNYLGLISQAEDSFSQSQAQALVDFLETIAGIEPVKCEESLPKLGYRGSHELAPAPSIGVFDFTKLPDYPLSFDVSAFYIVCPENCLGLHPEEERRVNLKSKIRSAVLQLNSIKKLKELAGFTERLMK